MRVLIVDDDERLARLTARYLEQQGVIVTCVHDGERGLQEALSRHYDAVLLDIMLPGRDGIAICRELRSRKDVPILMLTARIEEGERVLGLDSGADDYVNKPFSARELLARIRAHVRRARGQLGPTRAAKKVGRIRVDPTTRSATLDDVQLALTGYEFSLLFALAERAGTVLSREQLLELVKGNAEDAFDRSIDGHISRLRQKLGDDPKNPVLLKTIRGAGYILTGG